MEVHNNSQANPSKRSFAGLKQQASVIFDGWRKKKSETETTNLKRELGSVSVISYLIGGIIGTGIFISPVGVLRYSGSPGVALVVWFGCGAVSTLAGLCFAELGTSFPHSGSSYIYIKLAFGDVAAFFFQWVDVVLRKSTTLCVRFLTFSIYLLQPLYNGCQPPNMQIRLVAALAIFGLSYINALGVRWRTGFQFVTTIAKLGAMLFIFGLSIYHLCIGGVNHLENSWQGATTSAGSIAFAFSYGLYAYSGWDTMNSAVEEIRNPNRVLPLCMILSMLVVTVAYFLVNAAYFLVLDYEEILDSDAVAVVFAQKFFPLSAWFMSILVSVSAIGACNAAVFQCSRYYFAIAREGQLPSFMAMVKPEYNAPQPAIAVMTVLVLACLSSNGIHSLLVYYGMWKWSMVAFPIAAQLKLRYSYPNLNRPVKLPIIIPVVTLLLSLCLMIIPIHENWKTSMIALLLSLLCFPVYAFFFLWQNKPGWLQNSLNWINNNLAIWTQKLFLCSFVSDSASTNCNLVELSHHHEQIKKRQKTQKTVIGKAENVKFTLGN